MEVRLKIVGAVHEVEMVGAGGQRKKCSDTNSFPNIHTGRVPRHEWPANGMYILWKEKDISKYVCIARYPICVALDVTRSRLAGTNVNAPPNVINNTIPLENSKETPWLAHLLGLEGGTKYPRNDSGTVTHMSGSNQPSVLAIIISKPMKGGEYKFIHGCSEDTVLRVARVPSTHGGRRVDRPPPPKIQGGSRIRKSTQKRPEEPCARSTQKGGKDKDRDKDKGREMRRERKREEGSERDAERRAGEKRRRWDAIPVPLVAGKA
ncbi:hypothetical protein C8J57DRAFT_1229989 [Mycena rebaudengoi]|nr:hypothetical protein C8J57DRAFT_1229989 [Mycena rebaudengoi]